MLVTRQIEIDMGHRVTNHKSKCSNLHGHRYLIRVGCDDKIIQTHGASDEGMVIDFGDMKEILMDIIDKQFDHGFCMWVKDPFASMFSGLQNGVYQDDFQTDIDEETKVVMVDSVQKNTKPQKIIFVDFIPTAENLAKHWFELMKPHFEERNIKLKHVYVEETPNSSAIYEVE